jgi:transposase
MFVRLKDWRRIATLYDRYAGQFLSAIPLAVTVLLLSVLASATLLSALP